VHYDTFPPIEIDKNQAVRDFADRGVKLNLMEIGASKEF
jgi:hypothetical protein